MARPLWAQRYRMDAMEPLGNAIHLMGDVTSPAHQGYQEWNNYWSLSEQYSLHTKYERFDPGPGSALYTETQRAWDLFTSPDPLPTEILEPASWEFDLGY